MAEVDMLNSSTAVSVHVSEVVISISYVLSSTVTYTVERFRGLVHRDVQPKTRGRTERKLICYGLEYALVEQKPTQFSSGRVYNWYQTDDEGRNAGIFSLAAGNAINAVLLNNGFGPFVGQFNDYLPTGVQLNGSASQMALISDLAQGSVSSILFFHPHGYVVLNNYSTVRNSSFDFPLTCQVSQEPAEEGDHVNRVVTTGTRQGLYYPSGGGVEIQEAAISNTYNDATLQATQGILPHYITDSKISDANDINARAVSIVDTSQAKRYRWRSVLNPFVFPADTTTLTLTDSTTAEVTVYKVTDEFSWTEGEGGG
jgi:hypothetical protein